MDKLNIRFKSPKIRSITKLKLAESDLKDASAVVVASPHAVSHAILPSAHWKSSMTPKKDST